MPKIKTNKSAAKRFKVTGTGKLMRTHSLRNHLMINKGPGRSRRLAQEAQLSGTMKQRITRLLPTGVAH